MSGERKLLLEAEQSREDNTLHYSATNGHVAIQHRDLTPKSSKKGVADLSRHSALSGDSLSTASVLGSVVQPQDLQELMSNLERATALVKRYLQENQGLSTERRYNFYNVYLYGMCSPSQEVRLIICACVYTSYTDPTSRY